MRLSIFSPAEDSWIDPPPHAILRQIEGVTHGLDGDAVIVPITYSKDYKFAQGLSQLSGRKWVLVDFSEFGWDWNQESSFLWNNGDRMNHPPFGKHEEYRKFQEFILENPPIITFQRELLKKDATDRIVPIEYTAWLPDHHGNDTKEEFFKRPIEVSYNWSRSHESRMHMHGGIFTSASSFEFDVISEFSHVEQAIKENPTSKKWLSVHVPHYARIDVHEVQKFIRMSKVTISMPGCGVKCFRHGEVCCDAIMAIPKNNLAWSYPWDDSNSIVLNEFLSMCNIEEIQKFLNQSKEHQYLIYANAMENGRNYRYDNYLRRHVVGNIQKVL